MRACIQRVSQARVTIAGECCAEIGLGLVVLLGVGQGDIAADAQSLAEKIVGLRIFDDAAGKMNLALADVGGSILVVSQFTLLGDCRKGRRPSFSAAAAPAEAESLYEQFVAELGRLGAAVSTGRFRQHMDVSLTNSGPVTLIIDSRELR